MAFAKFALFQSHLDLAHSYWKQLVSIGDIVIDATCGNGNDTLVLAKLALSDHSGSLFAMDIQENAILTTQKLLQQHLNPNQYAKVAFLQGSHSSFPQEIPKESVTLITYNLGYLPGGNKKLTTKKESTLESLQNALLLLKPAGSISITCYPGHPEGKEEETSVLEFVSQLNPSQWSSCYHQWLNRKNSPSLLIIQKSLSS